MHGTADSAETLDATAVETMDPTAGGTASAADAARLAGLDRRLSLIERRVGWFEAQLERLAPPEAPAPPPDPTPRIDAMISRLGPLEAERTAVPVDGRLWSPRWSEPDARAGQRVALSIQADGIDPQVAVTVRILALDAQGHGEKRTVPLSELLGRHLIWTVPPIAAGTTRPFTFEVVLGERLLRAPVLFARGPR